MSLLAILLLAPFAGAAVSGLLALAFAHRQEALPKGLVATASCLAPMAAFVAALLAFLQLKATGTPLVWIPGDWIASGSFTLAWGFRFDHLAAVMALVITGIGSLIHLYSVSYMQTDPGFGRYFAYLNLFTGSMLVLVLADNLGLTFLGWEGVGLCSYFLIGFWFSDTAKAAAASKAFIVNRIGDAGFLCGMFLAYAAVGSLNYETIALQAPMLLPGMVTAIAAALFIGAIGKSGQLPLHVWLPDAMAGPTPVSALIHAATMVTAGVYLVARLNVVYQHAPTVSAVIAILGTVTALFAATVGMVQTNIKKVLAYSTVSQLGYMFLAVGVGAYAAGVFHLMTHAFFKALLFLAAGSVIHALANHEDLKDMGGLAKKLPLTRMVFLIATLAIAGFPPLAGFFSKDAILMGAWVAGKPLLAVVGLITGGITSYYMFRLYYLTFHSQNRNAELLANAHEAPPLMAIPLVVLAGGSVVAGFFGLPFHAPVFDGWLAPVFTGDHPAHDLVTTYLMMGAALTAAVAGWGLARRQFATHGQPVPQSPAGLHKLLSKAYYVDTLYQKGIVKPLLAFVRTPIQQWVERGAIDGAIEGGPRFYQTVADAVRPLQTGRVRDYGYVMLIGTFAMVIYLLVTWRWGTF